MTRKRVTPPEPKPKRRRSRLGCLALVLALVAAGAAVFTGWREYARERRIAALREERDALRARLAGTRGKDPAVAGAPDADVLVGVPEKEGARILGSLATGYLGNTSLTLRDLRVRKSGHVETSLLIGKVTPGYYHVDVRIHEVRGRLRPLAPEVHFAGPRLEVALPVRVTDGEGRATLRFRWDARGVAGAVCGDFRASVPVSGTVVSQTYTARGRLALMLSDGQLVATPRFPDLAVRLRIVPSAETWRAVDRVLSERSAGCRAALKLVDVRQLLSGILDKGFVVKVPQKIFKPMRFPAGLRTETTIRDQPYRVDVVPRTLTTPKGFAWYGADVSLVAEGHDGAEAGGPGRGPESEGGVVPDDGAQGGRETASRRRP